MDYKKHGVKATKQEINKITKKGDKMTKEDFNKINNKPSFSKRRKPFIEGADVIVKLPLDFGKVSIDFDANVLEYFPQTNSYLLQIKSVDIKFMSPAHLVRLWYTDTDTMKEDI